MSSKSDCIYESCTEYVTEFKLESNKEYFEGFKNGFHDGCGIKDNFKFSIFGMDVDEMLDALNEYREKKRKDKLVLNVNDTQPIIIKRHGKIVYED